MQHVQLEIQVELQAPYLCEGEGASNCGTVLSSLTGEYRPLISWNRKPRYTRAAKTCMSNTCIHRVLLFFQADNQLCLHLLSSYLKIFTISDKTLIFFNFFSVITQTGFQKSYSCGALCFKSSSFRAYTPRNTTDSVIIQLPLTQHLP